MSMRDRLEKNLSHFGHRVSARLSQLAALAMLLGLAVLAAALVSFHPADPSWNTTSLDDVQNWLGAPGAIFADAVYQIIGHGVWLAMLPACAFAWRRFHRTPIQHPNWRLLAGVLGVLVMSMALAVYGLAATPYAPFPGGALGQLLADALDAGTGALGVYLSRVVEQSLAIGLALVAITLSLVSSGWLKLTLAYAWRGMTKLRYTRQGLAALANLSSPLQGLRTAFVGVAQRLGWRRGRLEAGVSPVQDGVDAVDLQTSAGTQASPNVTVEAKKSAPKTGRRAAREAQPSLSFDRKGRFELPPLRLLNEIRAKKPANTLSKDALEANARLLETVLQDFGVRGVIGKVRPGPVVTLYELEPAAGVRSSRVVGLSDDIARSMSAVSCRVAPVPGANVIGIELPNATREIVSLRELLASADYENSKSKLTMALGKDIGGGPVMADLTKMPHLLVAGTTGSGKSVGINTMILSILYRMTPDQCRLILVDPKMLELSVYDGIPHLLAPVVTEPKKAIVALKWVVQEMENRYRKMAKIGVRNIEGFNDRMVEAKRTGETLTRRVQTGFDPDTGEAMFEEETIETEVLPFIVVVIDEMADLMMVAGKDIEAAVQRLAQMARAAGVHLITATQRPSVDVITGTIKANFPSRISFQVTSKIDSRTVLGEQGSEQLLGQGDMLFMSGGGRIQRVHGPFVSDEEVEKVVSFLKKQAAPNYIEQVTEAPPEDIADLLGGGETDSLYDQAVAIVTRDGRASTSYVQRRLQIGYNRAARLIEQMEEQGVISPPNHAGKREILAGKH
ncbi:DNA translocase FtsK [Alphaproteobacteria bacterium]|nr:DNA translocase FtsK [Alphaproteobacteria bacterium]